MEKPQTIAENKRIQNEILQLKNDNKKLIQKLEKSKSKTALLQKELKKSDLKIILSIEQEQLLSNLSKDINILNLLCD